PQSLQSGDEDSVLSLGGAVRRREAGQGDAGDLHHADAARGGSNRPESSGWRWIEGRESRVSGASLLRSVLGRERQGGEQGRFGHLHLPVGSQRKTADAEDGGRKLKHRR